MSASNRIDVNLDQEMYTGGQLISGKITVHTATPFECKGVYLEIRGKEIVEEHTSNGPVQSTTHVLKDKIALSSTEGTFQPGSYTYPFDYRLKDDIPASMSTSAMERSFFRSTAMDATVTYKMKAVAETSKIFAFNIKAKQELHILQKPPTTMKPVSNKIHATISQFLLIKKGDCHVRAHTDRDVYGLGEQATVCFSVENNSSQDFKAVKVCLCGRLSQRCGGHTGKETITIAEKEIPPSNRGKSMDGRHTFDIQMPTDSKKLLQPSLKGDRVELAYFFLIKLHATWAKDVRLELPIVIVPEQLLSRVQLQPSE